MFRDYFRVLLRSDDESCVLMVEENGQWDLPYFAYKPASKNTRRCMDDLHKLLALDPKDQCLTPIVPVALRYQNRGRGCGHLKWQQDMLGMAHLLLVDCHTSIVDLPENCAWQNSDFVRGVHVPDSYDNRMKAMLERTAQVLDKKESVMKELGQPQHKPGWYPNASNWLMECVARDGGQVIGNVCIVCVGVPMTLLAVNSNKGLYFLKAPSAPGKELAKTRTIAELMGEYSVDVIAVSKDLGSFVSREVAIVGQQHFSEKTGLDLRRECYKALATLQLESIKVIEGLVEGSVPVVKLDDLVNALENEWIYENKQFSTGGDFLFKNVVPSFVPLVKERVERLKKYKIPLTLIYGDFEMRNAGLKKGEDGEEKVVFLDWERAFISHPFFDFQNLRNTEPHLVDEYLSRWSEYECAERARECFELAYPLGWLVKAYFAAQLLKSCMPDSNSTARRHFIDCLEKSMMFVRKQEEAQIG